MTSFVRVYKAILEKGEIRGKVSEHIRAALTAPITTHTLTAAINHLVVAKLIGAERRCGIWDRVWVLPAPSEQQIAAMQPMVRARYVLTLLQLKFNPSLEKPLTAEQLEEGLLADFPYLSAATVMDRIFKKGLVKRPDTGQK